ncbi:hypothetical protein BV22DRAFT_1076604 [Leucogyrophana mollusca]|uniref:Uncharacterized protein n=1 Tax=Leucogyrophana mollusca TaxID=85980 RepID=A0ACB8AX16_9AGAM|nr:hypothetical protein BV22DRAFT_1076604 [Leucogyrophana mollusca]
MSKTASLDAAEVYTSRAQSGLYDSAVDQILELPHGTALAMSNYKDDFSRVTNNWSGNFSYQSTGTTVEHETILIGQLCHSSLGTKFSARGNHYPGTGFNPNFIDDKSRIKFLFTLSVPTKATHRMHALWDNQIATLNEVIDADRTEPRLTARQTLSFKEWTDHSTEDKALAPDLINILSGQIYVVPKGKQSTDDPTAKRAKIAKTTIAKSANVEEASNPVLSDFDTDMHDGEVKPALDGAIPTSPPVASLASPNDLFNPRVLPDYGGELFRHEKAMLRQLDMRDTDNNLVPPEAWYSTFTPGSLIMARVTMHAFSWESRRIYQLHAHSIRLLDGSREDVEERLGSAIPNNASPATSSNTAASNAMSSFSLGKRDRE